MLGGGFPNKPRSGGHLKTSLLLLERSGPYRTLLPGEATVSRVTLLFVFNNEELTGGESELTHDKGGFLGDLLFQVWGVVFA